MRTEKAAAITPLHNLVRIGGRPSSGSTQTLSELV